MATQKDILDEPAAHSSIHLVWLNRLRNKHGEAGLIADSLGGWCLLVGADYDWRFNGESIPEVFGKAIDAGLI